MKKAPISGVPGDFPAVLHDYIEGTRVYDSSCSPEARVYFIDSGYYLKTAARGTLEREYKMAGLFFERGLGVQAVCYVCYDNADWLLTRAAQGEDLLSLCDRPRILCREFAGAARRLHSLSPDGAPISALQELYIEVAEKLLSAPTDVPNFTPNRITRQLGINSQASALDALSPLCSGKLRTDALIHGDMCLPNLIACQDGYVTHFIDLGSAGAGDRNLDVYWALWTLDYNLGTPEYTELFLDLYGRADVDMTVIRAAAALEAFGVL